MSGIPGANVKQWLLDVGSSADCTEDTSFRFVTGAAFYQGECWYPAAAVHRCSSVHRISSDTVVVTLSKVIGRPAPVGKILMISPQLENILVPGRRVLGLGLSQALLMMQKPAGFLARNAQCATRLDREEGVEPGYDKKAVGVNDFLCSSVDTFQGDSGGPVYGIADDGTALVLLGVASGAIDSDPQKECTLRDAAPLNQISDLLDGPATDFNTVARLR
jgi:hypothetical protein